ncbi:MAG: recombinase family protein, partial [Oscillospiraceae bacterium]|nr:recombinase family protein [Oscillospiraceae bacterium]
YCGDLVQKKTYTPDFLSHEKKYNRGQEEFVIIKNHHEPIISRELFDKANSILDAKSLSQEGKSKYSNRYPFSGKIKCGRCGASYVARYKTRKDGSKYKSWRCFEGAKHGSPHIDKAGNQVGCSGTSIRNEEAIHIMYLVCKQLTIDHQKISDNLIKIINKVISMDMKNAATNDLEDKIKIEKQKRTDLIDLYTSGDIDRNEFTALRAKYDAEIESLKSITESIEKQQIVKHKQKELIEDIKKAIDELISGIESEDEFYTQLLDKMVINDRENIDVYLNLLPLKWSYKAVDPEGHISEATVPISVSKPLTSP